MLNDNNINFKDIVSMYSKHLLKFSIYLCSYLI